MFFLGYFFMWWWLCILWEEYFLLKLEGPSREDSHATGRQTQPWNLDLPSEAEGRTLVCLRVFLPARRRGFLRLFWWGREIWMPWKKSNRACGPRRLATSGLTMIAFSSAMERVTVLPLQYKVLPRCLYRVSHSYTPFSSIFIIYKCLCVCRSVCVSMCV